jgi:hypothetical protein
LAIPVHGDRGRHPNETALDGDNVNGDSVQRVCPSADDGPSRAETLTRSIMSSMELVAVQEVRAGNVIPLGDSRFVVTHRDIGDEFATLTLVNESDVMDLREVEFHSDWAVARIVSD